MYVDDLPSLSSFTLLIESFLKIQFYPFLYIFGSLGTSVNVVFVGFVVKQKHIFPANKRRRYDVVTTLFRRQERCYNVETTLSLFNMW